MNLLALEAHRPNRPARLRSPRKPLSQVTRPYGQDRTATFRALIFMPRAARARGADVRTPAFLGRKQACTRGPPALVRAVRSGRSRAEGEPLAIAGAAERVRGHARSDARSDRAVGMALCGGDGRRAALEGRVGTGCAVAGVLAHCPPKPAGPAEPEFAARAHAGRRAVEAVRWSTVSVVRGSA